VLIARYFIWVGGALLALLLIAGWVWPAATPDPAPADEAAQASPTNSTILRIRSARKWPDKVVIDTTIPTIVPPPAAQASAPPAPVVAENAPSPQPLDARAEMKPSAPPAPKRQARVHHRNSRPAASTWAAANPPPPSWGWSNSPHWSWNW
jgi:hypothetical protein